MCEAHPELFGAATEHSIGLYGHLVAHGNDAGEVVVQRIVGSAVGDSGSKISNN
jgi:folate-dependent phosphoribosylglycinamide formyltransferase PurN